MCGVLRGGLTRHNMDTMSPPPDFIIWGLFQPWTLDCPYHIYWPLLLFFCDLYLPPSHRNQTCDQCCTVARPWAEVTVAGCETSGRQLPVTQMTLTVTLWL